MSKVEGGVRWCLVVVWFGIFYCFFLWFFFSLVFFCVVCCGVVIKDKSIIGVFFLNLFFFLIVSKLCHFKKTWFPALLVEKGVWMLVVVVVVELFGSGVDMAGSMDVVGKNNKKNNKKKKSKEFRQIIL